MALAKERMLVMHPLPRFTRGAHVVYVAIGGRGASVYVVVWGRYE